MIVTFTPCSKRAFSDVLEGVAMKNFLGEAPRTPSFSPASSTDISVLCYAVVDLPAFILKRCHRLSQIGEFICCCAML